jgi:hypothetical protein
MTSDNKWDEDIAEVLTSEQVQFADHERPVTTSREGYEALCHSRQSPQKAIRAKVPGLLCR